MFLGIVCKIFIENFQTNEFQRKERNFKYQRAKQTWKAVGFHGYFSVTGQGRAFPNNESGDYGKSGDFGVFVFVFVFVGVFVIIIAGVILFPMMYNMWGLT